jgi:hypothetical protein
MKKEEFSPRWFVKRVSEFGIAGICKDGEWVSTNEYWHTRGGKWGFKKVVGKMPDLR